MAQLLDFALCTVEDVKESLGIASSDHSQDNIIIRKINQATMMIENYCGRRFTLTTYTNEEYDATNTDQLILKNRPVVTFTSLDIRDTALNEDDWDAVDSELYFVDQSAGVIDLNFGFNGRWNRMRVSYSAGYSTIPADLAEACATLAGFLVQNPTTIAAVKSKEEGQRRIEYYSTSGTGSGGSSLFDQLGLTQMFQPYLNYPILANK